VVVGLFVYAFIARNTPLGGLGLLFTPTAIVIGQVLLIIPLVTALVHSAVQDTVHPVYEEASLLGASPLQASAKALVESRLAVTTALMTGFGRVISEVGISLVLGGNIRGVTRTITTAITLETSQGEFAAAFALGIVLLALVFCISLIIQMTDRRREAV
jgi:tungstate transport system permease protein